MAAAGDWQDRAFAEEAVVDIDDVVSVQTLFEPNADFLDTEYIQEAVSDIAHVAHVNDLEQDLVEEGIREDGRHVVSRQHDDDLIEGFGLEPLGEYQETETMTAARLAACEKLLISKEVTYDQQLFHQREQNNLSLAESIDALHVTKAEAEKRLQDQEHWREELKATQQGLEETCAKRFSEIEKLEGDGAVILESISHLQASKTEMDQQIDVARRHVNEMAMQEEILRSAQGAESAVYRSLEAKRARLAEGLKSLLASGAADGGESEREGALIQEVTVLIEQLPGANDDRAERLEELVPRIRALTAKVAELKASEMREAEMVKARRAEHDQLEEQVLELEDKVSERRTQLESCVRNSRTLVAKLTQLMATAEECQKSVEESKALCESVARQSKMAEADITEHRSTLAHYERMTEDLVKRRDAMKEEQANRDGQIRQVLHRSQDLLKQIDAAEKISTDQGVRLKELNDQIDQITSQTKKMDTSKAAKAEQVTLLESKHAEITDELETSKEQVRQQDERVRANRELQESLEQQLQQARSELSVGELRLTESQVGVGRLMADLDIFQKRMRKHEMQSHLSDDQVAAFDRRLTLLQRMQETWELRDKICMNSSRPGEEVEADFEPPPPPDIEDGSGQAPVDVAQYKRLPVAYRALSDYVSSFTAFLHAVVASSLRGGAGKPGSDSPWKASPYIMCGGSGVSADMLKKFGVGAVVNLASGTSEQPRYLKDGADFPSLWVPMSDSLSYDVCEKFQEVHQFIKDQEDRKVLTYVHCCRGVNRSPTMIISYLTWRARQADESAKKQPIDLLLENWEQVAQACGQPYPLNPWFQKQLVIWALNYFDRKRVTSDPAWGPSMFRSRAEYMLRKKYPDAHKKSRDAFASELVYAEGKLPDAFDMATSESVERAVERIQGYMAKRLHKRVAAESSADKRAAAEQSAARSQQPNVSQQPSESPAAEVGWTTGVLNGRTQISID